MALGSPAGRRHRGGKRTSRWKKRRGLHGLGATSEEHGKRTVRSSEAAISSARTAVKRAENGNCYNAFSSLSQAQESFGRAEAHQRFAMDNRSGFGPGEPERHLAAARAEVSEAATAFKNACLARLPKNLQSLGGWHRQNAKRTGQRQNRRRPRR